MKQLRTKGVKRKRRDKNKNQHLQKTDRLLLLNRTVSPRRKAGRTAVMYNARQAMSSSETRLALPGEG